MAEGTRNNVLHVPAACTVPHMQGGYPSSVAGTATSLGPPLGVLAPSPSLSAAGAQHRDITQEMGAQRRTGPLAAWWDTTGHACGSAGSVTAGDKLLPLLPVQVPSVPGTGRGVQGPPGMCPPGRAIPGSDAGSCTQLVGAPGRKCCFLPQALGMGRASGGWGWQPCGYTAPLVWHPTAPTLHHPQATQEPWVPHKVSPSAASYFRACKRENDEAGEILVAPALGTLALPLAKPLPSILTQKLEC